MTETEKNQEIADMICQDACWNDRKFTVGDWVALLDGEIVTVADSVSDALATLRSTDPNPKRGMLFQVRPLVLDVIR